jgi:single-stranded-DNA-specific exonuclease
MERRWKIHPFGNANDPLARELGVDPLIGELLYQRGVRTFDEARSFFRPDLKLLHDPFLMKGMRTAVQRILKAIAANEKVLIYGDYDVDGTTAVSIAYSFFRKYIEHIDYYIPDRYKEGYGISVAGIDFAAANHFSLVIALDCGIKANEKIQYAREKKVDFIICDHHLPGATLPDAVAVLDPKQADCTYPFQELSGAGIAFKLIQAFCMKQRLPDSECVKYLDLVAMSIAADIVPIVGENRILAAHGLIRINSEPGPGIKALLKLNQIEGKASIHSLVFVLGPRINAAGRIEHGSKAVELLTCDNEEKAAVLAASIDDTNSLRKDIDIGITGEALSILETETLTVPRKTTVLFNENWHKGVIGIVASRLIEKYYRPTIILTEHEGKITGSARSVREFDIYTAIEQCGELLEQFGGHRFAAGLTLRRENVDAFRARFEEVVNATITEEQLMPKLEIDAELEFHDITPKLLRVLKQFAPHGPENMTPVFCARKVFDTGWAQVIGSNHLRLELYQQGNPAIRFRAIAFD